MVSMFLKWLALNSAHFTYSEMSDVLYIHIYTHKVVMCSYSTLIASELVQPNYKLTSEAVTSADRHALKLYLSSRKVFKFNVNSQSKSEVSKTEETHPNRTKQVAFICSCTAYF